MKVLLLLLTKRFRFVRTLKLLTEDLRETQQVRALSLVASTRRV